MFPSNWRVYAYQGDYQLVAEPLLVAVDITGSHCRDLDALHLTTR
jgi:hypothetical protein